RLCANLVFIIIVLNDFSLSQCKVIYTGNVGLILLAYTESISLSIIFKGLLCLFKLKLVASILALSAILSSLIPSVIFKFFINSFKTLVSSSLIVDNLSNMSIYTSLSSFSLAINTLFLTICIFV